MLIGGGRRRPAQYAALGDVDDQLGNIFSSAAKGIAKGAKGIVKGAGAGIKALPGAAKSVGAFGVNIATLPSRTALGLAKGVSTSIASNAGKMAGGLLKLPLDVTGALVKGAISPFKPSGGAGGGGEPAPAPIETSTSVSPAPSITSTGGGASYGGGGGGYGGGGDSGIEAHGEQGLTIQETGMPMWQKLALGAAAVGGAFLLYKKFGKGGRSARRTKSR